MTSPWMENSCLPHFPPLREDIKTDVLIIGGGMAGLLCAYMLDRAGIDYVLAEAGTIASGITKNTTAKITSQHGLIYHKLIKRFGQEAAGLYLQANEQALGEFKTLCKNFDCGFEEKSSFVYTLNDSRKLEHELRALETLGFPAKLAEELPLPFPVAGAVEFDRQAQFHPLKFITAISKGLKIFEHTKVTQLLGCTAVTGGGKIQAEKIIVATHFPFLNKHGAYFLKLYQHRSYVIALENAPDMHGMYLNDDEKGLSFRNYDRLLFVGGGSHRTGKKGGSWQELRSFAARFYPEVREKYHWATQDCMSLDEIPYIGPYSANTENIYVAAGFNKWGMTGSMVSALLLQDLLQGRGNPYAELFSPSRNILHPQLAVNAFESAVNLLTPSSKRCPHLGCALKWNAAERSWDCPCHGSRFTEDGGLIDNPATGDLKK